MALIGVDCAYESPVWFKNRILISWRTKPPNMWSYPSITITNIFQFLILHKAAKYVGLSIVTSAELSCVFPEILPLCFSHKTVEYPILNHFPIPKCHKWYKVPFRIILWVFKSKIFQYIFHLSYCWIYENVRIWAIILRAIELTFDLASVWYD